MNDGDAKRGRELGDHEINSGQNLVQHFIRNTAIVKVHLLDQLSNRGLVARWVRFY